MTKALKVFESAVNMILKTFENKYDIQMDWDYHLDTDRYIGPFLFNDFYSISLDDIIHMLKYDIPIETYYNYIDEGMEGDNAYAHLNFQSYAKGLSFDKVRNKKKELEQLFDTMQSDVAMSHHLADGYLEDLKNFL